MWAGEAGGEGAAPAGGSGHRPLPQGGRGQKRVRLRRRGAPGGAPSRRHQVRQNHARAFCRQGRARRSHPAVRLHGARAADRPRRCDRRSGRDREDAARQRSRRRGGHHACVGAADRQPGGAQDQARRDAAAHRRLRQSGAQMKLRRLSTRAAGFDAKLAALTRYEAAQDPAVQKTVRRILAEVRARGDAAVRKYAKKFDGVALRQFEIPRTEIQKAIQSVPRAQADALQSAFPRIKSFHERQLQKSWDYTDEDGKRLGQRVTALERFGLYVPGGKAAYPSTVLMNAVPAKVAGVRELLMASPNPNPLVLAAAALAGVDRVFGIGGAQAVAALAYGTKSVPRVDKIVGPGNAYVAEAKRQVFGEVGIDMLAGPSEILVISDGKTPADWVAMDLFSQAEHDEDAQAMLLSPDENYLEAVARSMQRLIGEMSRKSVISASLKARGALILTRDLDEACALASRIAPEHLELSVENPEAWLPKLGSAGAIFLGRWSSEAVGDYCAGPNHVLPTSGTARFSSPLGVYDFQKRSSLISVSQKSASILGQVAATLAEGEGLTAHARSAEMRFH